MNDTSRSMITDTPESNTAPIGIFDSGFGGLTVLKEIARILPMENVVFLGDSARCPYGPRDLSEVEGFVLQICSYLVSRGCKMIVIACNTATAAGLKRAQMTFDIPIVGVVEPGARAAAHITKSRRVGVIATEGTIRSGAYENAIKNIDAGIKIFSNATPQFVNIAEAGLTTSFERVEPFAASAASQDVLGEQRTGSRWDPYKKIAEDYLDPLMDSSIDTLVLGCTHFPIIQHLIADVVGPSVKLVSSAEETARDVSSILERKGDLATDNACPTKEFLTTSYNLQEFSDFGTKVFGEKLENVKHIDLM